MYMHETMKLYGDCMGSNSQLNTYTCIMVKAYRARAQVCTLKRHCRANIHVHVHAYYNEAVLL